MQSGFGLDAPRFEVATGAVVVLFVTFKLAKALIGTDEDALDEAARE